jgi:hypothetical protein
LHHSQSRKAVFFLVDSTLPCGQVGQGLNDALNPKAKTIIVVNEQVEVIGKTMVQ